MPYQSSYLSLIEPIIKQAGKVAVKKWQTFDRQDSNLKNKKEIVTEVDISTEKFLIKSIIKLWPEYSFLAEESGLKKQPSDFLWLIDPIDGTTNFSIHNPLWSISIGLKYKKDIIFGVVYLPIIDELFWAEKKRGAYLNGRRLKINTNKQPKKLIHTYCHGSNQKDVERAIAYYGYQKRESLDCRRLGSAAIELSYVAAGRVDSLVIPGAKSWDVAAGALIAQEAGADVRDFSGKKWSLESPDIAVFRPDIKKNVFDILKKIPK